MKERHQLFRRLEEKKGSLFLQVDSIAKTKKEIDKIIKEIIKTFPDIKLSDLY